MEDHFLEAKFGEISHDTIDGNPRVSAQKLLQTVPRIRTGQFSFRPGGQVFTYLYVFGSNMYARSSRSQPMAYGKGKTA